MTSLGRSGGSWWLVQQERARELNMAAKGGGGGGGGDSKSLNFNVGILGHIDSGKTTLGRQHIT